MLRIRFNVGGSNGGIQLEYYVAKLKEKFQGDRTREANACIRLIYSRLFEYRTLCLSIVPLLFS